MTSKSARRWRRFSRKAGAALRLCVSILVLAQLIYIPIHLATEAHSHETDSPGGARAVVGPASLGGADYEGDGHHEEHPALQHQLKVVRSQRAPAPEMVMAPAIVWVETAQERPFPELLVCSGLSPPELSRSWQFVFRAALPVRAPSILS